VTPPVSSSKPVGSSTVKPLDFWGPNGEMCGTSFREGESEGCTKARNLQDAADEADRRAANAMNDQARAAAEFDAAKARAARIDLFNPNEPSALDAVVRLSQSEAYKNLPPAQKAQLWAGLNIAMSEGTIGGNGLQATARLFEVLKVSCAGNKCSITNLTSDKVNEALADLGFFLTGDRNRPSLGFDGNPMGGGILIALPIIAVAAIGVALIWYVGAIATGNGLGDIIARNQPFLAKPKFDDRGKRVKERTNQDNTYMPPPDPGCDPRNTVGLPTKTTNVLPEVLRLFPNVDPIAVSNRMHAAKSAGGIPADGALRINPVTGQICTPGGQNLGSILQDR
jgi:hypothetical protein